MEFCFFIAVVDLFPIWFADGAMVYHAIPIIYVLWPYFLVSFHPGRDSHGADIYT
jgi:hypothetical protein